MNNIQLPIGLEDIDQIRNRHNILDMSKLNFPVEDVHKIRAAFIFMRNANFYPDLDFSNCSFLDKERALLIYIQDNIEIHSTILSDTWIQILLSKYDIPLSFNSIFIKEEIDEFIKRNNVFMHELYWFINSIPLCAILANKNKLNIDLSEIPVTSYDKIKLINFHNLCDYDEFTLLITPDSNMKPMIYSKIFHNNNRYLNKMIHQLPYLNMMTAMLSSSEQQQDIINAFNNLLDNKENS